MTHVVAQGRMGAVGVGVHLWSRPLSPRCSVCGCQQSICAACHRWPPPVIPENPPRPQHQASRVGGSAFPPPSSSFTFQAAVPSTRRRQEVFFPSFPPCAGVANRRAVKRLDLGGKIAFILLPLNKYSDYCDKAPQQTQLVNNGGTSTHPETAPACHGLQLQLCGSPTGVSIQV